MYDKLGQKNYLNVFFGESSLKNKSFSVQQGDYNSNEVICNLYDTNESGKSAQMDLTDATVTVVFKRDGGRPTTEYSTEIDDTAVGRIRFCIPQRMLSKSGNAVQQLRIYGDDSLLNSVILPFMIEESIHNCGHEDGCKPITLTVLQKVEAALDEFEMMRDELTNAEAERTEQFEQWEEQISGIVANEQEVVNMDTHYDFPSVGDVNKIYKAYQEKKIYQWNEAEQKYEVLSVMDDMDGIEIIYGGDANGTD